MHKIHPELQRLGAGVLVISFAPPSHVQAYVKEYPQPFPVVADPTLSAYHAFGLERTSVGVMFRLGVIGRYLLHIFRGWLPAKRGAGEDVLQLGGDFILDAGGVVRYAHPSQEPTDRPSAAELLRQLKVICEPNPEQRQFLKEVD